jgi:hypothetical protein
LWLAPVAFAVDPATIYADYVADGKLSCAYSRADLQATLNGVTLNQYGDPYVAAGLERAIRRQLAPGGCARRDRRSSGIWWTLTIVGIPAVVVFLVGGWSARRAHLRPSQ